MCFGNTQQTGSQTTTYPAWLSGAANSNVGFAQNLQSAGFQPYTGQMVANFSPQQQASFGMGTGIAGAINPQIQTAGAAYGNVLNGAANQPTVNAETISSQMSPYMNAYVGQALAPQVSNLNNQLALQSQLTQGQATSAGAYGDPRATMLQQNQNAAGSLQEQGLVGNAYNAAFNTAIGAGAQDVASNLQAQTTNAGLYNTGLQTQLGAANAVFGQGNTANNLVNTLGAQQTAQSQAGLNAAYNQYLMAQQYPFQTTQLLNQTIGAATQPSGATTTTYAPNNAGYGLLGSLLGAGGSAAGGYFSGAGAAGAAAAGGSAGSSALAALPLLALAKGGPAEGDKPYLVGERGPELFVPKKSGTVVPYEKLRDAIAKKKSVSTSGLAKQLGIAA
jgi:hypothetical protein